VLVCTILTHAHTHTHTHSRTHTRRESQRTIAPSSTCRTFSSGVSGYAQCGEAYACIRVSVFVCKFDLTMNRFCHIYLHTHAHSHTHILTGSNRTHAPSTPSTLSSFPAATAHTKQITRKWPHSDRKETGISTNGRLRVKPKRSGGGGGSTCIRRPGKCSVVQCSV
jgi:hypothetical protein